MEEDKWTEEIKYEHYRYDQHGELRRYYRSNTNWTPAPCGGMTICTISVGGYEFQGIAKCNHFDAFRYRLGRTIALGRARKEESEWCVVEVGMNPEVETDSKMGIGPVA